MSNYNVFLEGAWLVKDVATGEDAIGIAISEAGKRLNPKLEYVGVDVGTMACAACGENFMSVYVVADTALVGLLFQMKVYEAEGEEHAVRIATSVVGKALRDVPLKLVSVDEFMFESKSKPRESGSDFGRVPKRDERSPNRGNDRGFNEKRESNRNSDGNRESHRNSDGNREGDRGFKGKREFNGEKSDRNDKKAIEYD